MTTTARSLGYVTHAWAVPRETPTMLEGMSREYDEDATMDAIRSVMGEEKRQSSRRVFPELYPTGPSNETDI